VFDFYVQTVKRLFGDIPWCAAGIGRHQAEINAWCAAAGGHLRTGLEDNIRMDKTTLAPSNAALVTRAAEICHEHGRAVATPAQAREMLGLA
jgi:3-keto-5-aminohexanoate cleavage enzyme